VLVPASPGYAVGAAHRDMTTIRDSIAGPRDTSDHAVSISVPQGRYARLVCTDFYTAVNGDWADHMALPVNSSDTLPLFADRPDTLSISKWGILAAASAQSIRALLADARVAAPTTRDPLTRILGTFYQSCLVTPRDSMSPASTPASTAPAPETDGGVARCVGATQEVLGNALSRAYLRAVTTPARLARARTLAEELRSAMEARFRAATWMSPRTKDQALHTLSRMRFLIGTTDGEVEDDTVTLSPTDYAGNRAALQYVAYKRSLTQDEHTPKTLTHGATPYTINALYRANVNAVEIPAALLHEPLFNPDSDAIENYAGLGYIMGHEMSHAFDTEGFHANAADSAAWTEGDRAYYRGEVAKLVAEYDGFTVGGLHMSGAQTIHENLADLGGVAAAFDVYMRYRRRHGQQPAVSRRRPSVDASRITPAQWFFLAYATINRVKQRHANDTMLLGLDGHSAYQWRVNGTLAAMPEFARAFDCKPGDPMALTASARPALW